MSKKENYYYAGVRMMSDNKLDHMLISVDKKNTILFSGKCNSWIGELVEVTHKPRDRFIRKRLMEDHKSKSDIDKARIDSKSNEFARKKYLSRKKLKSERNKLDNMTLGDIKEYCKNNIARTLLVKEYLREGLI